MHTQLLAFDTALSSLLPSKKPPLIIFTDPGVDDMLMLIQILRQKKYPIAGIIPIRGNASSEMSLTNSLAICEYLGRTDVKVYPGKKEKFKGFPVYGKNALNGHTLPVTKHIKPENITGINFAANYLQHHQAIIISTGPLTEPAELLYKIARSSYASLKNIIGISLMGGVINTTQEANYPITGKRFTEANVADNPKATKKVFDIAQKNNIPIFLSPLDLTHSILVSKSDIQSLKKSKKCSAQSAYKLISNVPLHYRRRFGKGPDQYYRQPLHDVHATHCLLHPEQYHGRWVTLKVNKKLVHPHFSISNEKSGNVFLLSLPGVNREAFVQTLVKDYN